MLRLHLSWGRYRYDFEANQSLDQIVKVFDGSLMFSEFLYRLAGGVRLLRFFLAYGGVASGL